MTEEKKKSEDKGKNFASFPTDLRKAFDCLPHNLILAKLTVYGYFLPVPRLMQSYLSNRKQITKINTACSSWEEMLFDVHQDSFIGPLLFNISVCNLFLIMNKADFSSYADDNTTHVIENVLKKSLNF